MPKLWVLVMLALPACALDEPSDPQVDVDDDAPVEGRVIVTETTCAVLEPLEFVEGSTAFANGAPILDAVAETLIGNPSITKIGVSGHTDPLEAEGGKLQLARAAITIQALIDRGVAPERFETITDDDANSDRNVGFLILERE